MGSWGTPIKTKDSVEQFPLDMTGSMSIMLRGGYGTRPPKCDVQAYGYVEDDIVILGMDVEQLRLLAKAATEAADELEAMLGQVDDKGEW